MASFTFLKKLSVEAEVIIESATSTSQLLTHHTALIKGMATI